MCGTSVAEGSKEGCGNGCKGCPGRLATLSAPAEQDPFASASLPGHNEKKQDGLSGSRGDNGVASVTRSTSTESHAQPPLPRF